MKLASREHAMSEAPVVGIDLGTTNSLIAYINSANRPEIIPNREGKRLTPSVVYAGADGEIVVGEHARRTSAADSANVASSFKRDMGKGASYYHGGRAWTPAELSAEVLKKLKSDAEFFLGTVLKQCVVTVPAYFLDAQRTDTRAAAEAASFEVLQMVHEPTAAALAYGYRHGQRKQCVMVYDLGGGTFDVSLVEIASDGLKVIATDGNHELGGKNWDDCLVEYICQEFRERAGLDPSDDAEVLAELRIRAEEAKQDLSQMTRVVVPVHCGGRMERIEVTRARFEELTQSLLNQTKVYIHKVLAETGYTTARLDTFLMVGGSTRMPACRELVRRATGREPSTDINPDECVALGAAIQGTLAGGRISSGHSGLVWSGGIRDVMSHSMGMIAVSSDGGRYVNSILIPRNRPIPCREVRPFAVHVAQDAPASIDVFVTQGETENPMDCTFVGKYTVYDVPHSAEGETLVDIRYEYNYSGVVEVSAVDHVGGRALTVEKQPEVGDLSWIREAPVITRATGKTVYAAVDLSGSMSGKPLADAQQAVLDFAGKLHAAGASVGIISFADKVVVDQRATRELQAVEDGIRSWTIGPVGYGNSADPFGEALRLLSAVAGERYLVVLTDGHWGAPREAEIAARTCREAGIEIAAVGFGSANREFLSRIATTDEAAMLVGSHELTLTLGRIAREVTTGGLQRRGG
jgi:molecular chaperone DnaK (HSP70)